MTPIFPIFKEVGKHRISAIAGLTPQVNKFPWPNTSCIHTDLFIWERLKRLLRFSGSISIKVINFQISRHIPDENRCNHIIFLSISNLQATVETFDNKLCTYPRKYAFFVSQKSLTPTWGNISFCKISRAYLILLSFVTPGRAPRAPMKFSATFCSWITNASSSEGLT